MRCATTAFLMAAVLAGCADETTSPKTAAPPPKAETQQAKTEKPPPPKLADVVPPDPAVDESFPTPFGDRYDPTKPKPPAPETKGPGITAAKLVASGDADVAQLPKPPNTGSAFYAVVVDVTVAAGSTTDALAGASVQLQPASGDPVPLFAACMPSLEDAGALHLGKGSSSASWDVAIGSRTWKCGGRTARLLVRIGEGGFRLINSTANEWTSPMVLLFEGQASPPKSVVVLGRTIELPAQAAQGAAAN